MNIYENRKNVILIIIGLVFVVFWARLFYLQIINSEFKQFAEENVLQKRTIYPPRGLILDRNEKMLVSNMSAYDLMVIPAKVSIEDTLSFCRILDISREDFVEKYNTAKKYSNYKPSLFLKNISLQTYGEFQERMFEFKGFFVVQRTIRSYPYSTAPHLAGYIGEVNEKKVEESNGEYHRGDYIGISGLEKHYEEKLKGKNGLKYILVNVLNIEQGSYLNGEQDKPAEAGQALLTTLDIDLQKYVESLFVNKIGSLVAIDPSTGGVLAMVSSPGFDPAKLNSRDRSSYYYQLITDPAKPMFNRAISAMYPPGSTFKIAMALTGLQEQVITPSTIYHINGGYFLRGLKIGDHIFGPVNLYTSIVKSSNAYYCYVFRAIIDNKVYPDIYKGYNTWRNYMLNYGFGKKLNIDLDNEVTGILPVTNRFDRMYGKNRWKSPNILSLAIGQAEISLTPLQLANFSALVANRGYYISPHLVQAFEDASGNVDWINYDKNVLPLDSHSFTLVIDAMQDVLLRGTAIRYGPHFKEFKICGKTGTSQNPHGEDHSVFIAFAPKYNPKIAVAAVVENAGQGAHWAAPICMLAIEKYLSRKIKDENKYIEDIMHKGDFVHKIGDTASVVIPPLINAH